MASRPQTDPDGESGVDPVADLVARVILALECDGKAAAAALLDAEPAHADAARARIEALRAAGMLREDDGTPPERIGPFRVLERLGRGGMGEVYLAEQRTPVRRRVALKVIRRGMDTREVLARFTIERQALALLDHPNIAKVLDAGETADGRPYLVMEYVSGLPLHSYCDERGLDTEARLRLFAEVCDTVQHAHERGILHRDLKPSNVLVADRDGRPWPKLIDLGVAKSLQQRLDAATLHTVLGQVLGTPGYMSPEQAANRVDLDTRTDVYSLGVMLYELLTGRLPIEPSRLQRVGPTELERILRDEDPPTPSTRIGTLGADSSEVAMRRGTWPAALRRRLRGDLDWITMKALERDRNRRYPMAAALALDLRRHLAYEPVTAGPPGAWYRISRLVRRHRATATAVAAVFVSLVFGLLASVSFWHEARAAQASETAARREVEDALDVALRAADELLVEVGGERLRRFPGLAAERRRLLEGGLAFCRSVLERAPATARSAARAGLVQARIAWFQLELGLLDDAEATLAAIVVPAGDDADAQHVRLATANVRASIAQSRGRHDDAVAGRQQALEAAQALARQAPGDAELEDRVGVCRGQLAAALAAVDPGSAATADAFAAAHRETLRAVERDGTPAARLSQLLRNWAAEASWAIEQSRPADAEPVLVALEAQLRRLLDADPDDPLLLEELAPALEMRARALLVRGRGAESEQASREAIRIREKLVGLYPGDPGQAAKLSNACLVLADNLMIGFRFQEALEFARRAVGIREASLERDPASVHAKVDLAFALSKRAMVSADWQRLKPDLALDDALADTARAVALVADLDPATLDVREFAFRVGNAHFVRAQVAEAVGDLDTARDALRRSIEHAEGLLPRTQNRASMLITMQALYRASGRVELRRGDAAAARVLLERSVAVEDDLRASGADYMNSEERLRETLNLLARAALADGDLRAAEAAAVRAIDCAPAFQITHREGASVLAAIAEAHQDEAERRRILEAALRECDLAREALFAQHGQGPDGTHGLMYQLTESMVLEQRVAVLEALGDRDRLEAAWRAMLELARAIRTTRDDARAQRRVGAAYAALIGCAVARGDEDEAARLAAARDSELGPALGGRR